MEFAGDDVLALSYQERRLVVVVGDDEVEVRRGATETVAGKGPRDSVPRLAAAAAGAFPRAVPLAVPVIGLAGVAVVAVAVGLRKLKDRSERAGLELLAVTDSQARNLMFPVGHPRRRVVYAAEPGAGGNYFPVAEFHRYVFDRKVSEALRLVRSLGATDISIEHVEGFDHSAGIDLSASPQDVAVGAAGNSTRRTDSGAKFTMQLAPTLPAHVPSDLNWFASEPLWQEVASARLESGLRSFALDLSYTQDLGVDANLKAKITSVGLDVGGTYQEHRRTVWKLSGTFAEPGPST
jgi:hypothetical protein